MTTSPYLARLIGPVLAVAGASMLLRPSGYVTIIADMLRSPALLYIACALGLLGGIALVLAHNVWTSDWRVIITLVGWISVLESAVWMLFPTQAERLASPMLSSPLLPLWGGAIVLLVGAVLSYFGYRDRRA